MQKKFEFKMIRAIEMFREEVANLKGQNKLIKAEGESHLRLIDKMQKMVMSAEDQITRMKLALNLGDIEKMYDTLKINIPRKIKLALWLVM